MENENLKIYEKVRKAPKEALRTISGGRLNGMTDVSPMWRIEILTDTFGPCGVGWYTQERKKWMESGANGEVAAFVDIDLFVKIDGEWSKPIPGTGGSMFVSKEQKGLYTDDEAFKKAYTDAISVAAKALGVAADVYWNKDTKYPHEGGKAPQTGTGGKPSGTGGKAPQTGTGGEREHRSGISLTELRNFGCRDIRATAQALGKKFGKPITALDADETARAWEILNRKKRGAEIAEQYRKGAEESGEPAPWDVQDEGPDEGEG